MDRTTFAKRLGLSVIALVGVAYVGVCAYLWTRQRELIFQPQAVLLRSPKDVGAEVEDLDIAVADGGVIHAWWLPGDSSMSAAATLLYLRGNDGNLGEEVDRLAALHRYGLPILAIDYRGYGQSSGPTPSESQLYEDAVAAWDYLVRARGVDPKRIIVYGHSLGGAVAAELALRRAPACGIVFESTFTSVAELGQMEYPMIPVDWLLTQRFDALSRIARLDLPMVFIHGTADEVVPVAMPQRLYRAARAQKQLILVQGAGHEDAMPAGGQPVSAAIAGLVRQCGEGQ